MKEKPQSQRDIKLSVLEIDKFSISKHPDCSGQIILVNNTEKIPKFLQRDKIYFINPDDYNLEDLKRAIQQYTFTIELDAGLLKCLAGLFEYYNKMAPLEYVESLLADPAQKMRIEWVASKCSGRILNIGSCSGYLETFHRDVVSVDISKSRLLFLKSRVTADWAFSITEYLPFRDNVFDTVVLAEVIEHLVDPETAIREAIRVAKPEGKIVITVPDEEDSYWTRNIEHLRFFTKKTFEDLLKKFNLRFSIERTGLSPRLFLCSVCEVVK
jgi:SAM-dependent methyltransferase